MPLQQGQPLGRLIQLERGAPGRLLQLMECTAPGRSNFPQPSVGVKIPGSKDPFAIPLPTPRQRFDSLMQKLGDWSSAPQEEAENLPDGPGGGKHQQQQL